MTARQGTLRVDTRGPGLTEITRDVVAWVAETSPDIALLTLLIQHTSASLLIQENADPEVQDDLVAYFHRLVPPTSDPSMAYLTHTYEGPDDMPGHIKAALLPVSVQIPVTDSRLRLGRWQGIYVVEHRARAQSREVVLHLG